ncbi:modulator of macroautophagy TMEM150B [Peromyscus californicus insignis]|uniref:modulator of macroautophagy TMEM150B n=1 Tax=Peromyscus californicus insignis TaxID=564181 RepID=UPI0022A7A14A|nr:modulator of macroautophagy TMEM150B [Peromyscus californicus insignis]
MWNYLYLLPVFLALWAAAGIWIVFAIAVANRTVDLGNGFPFISKCGSYAPQSCIFGQVLNTGAALACWICIVRYHQLRDWGVKTWQNQLILWTGLLCALGTSIVGNFQENNQKATHLIGAFLAFILGNLYFWLQFFLSWWVKGLPQPGPRWIRCLRQSFCILSTVLIVAMIILYSQRMRSASAVCEWAVAMLLFVLFGFFAVDFSSLRGCALQLQPKLDSSLSQAPSESPNTQMSQAL